MARQITHSTTHEFATGERVQVVTKLKTEPFTLEIRAEGPEGQVAEESFTEMEFLDKINQFAADQLVSRSVAAQAAN